MNAHDIVIGGLRVAFDSAYTLTQSYTEIGGSTLHRMLNGAGVKQQHWSKLRTVISGSGRVPIGLNSLDYTSPIEIQCMAAMSLSSSSTNVFTLPAARRSDWAPVGYALVDGRLVRTSCAVATNTATLGTVSGASGYQVLYWPTLTVYAGKPTISYNGRAADGGWSLEAEEI